MAQKIQIRRGLEAQRTSITPDVGEPLFTTDTKQLFVGDGTTAGGVAMSGGSSGGGGSGGPYVAKLRGTLALATGADSATASGLALASAPAQVLITVRKPTAV